MSKVKLKKSIPSVGWNFHLFLSPQVPLMCHCFLLHLLIGCSAHMLRKLWSDVSGNFFVGSINLWIPLFSRGRPLFSTNKTFMMVLKPSLSTFCTASRARLCIPQWVHMLNLCHGQQLLTLLNKVRKQSAADPGDEILHSSFLGRKRRAETLSRRKKKD